MIDDFFWSYKNMNPNLGDRFFERGKALEVADKKSGVLFPAEYSIV